MQLVIWMSPSYFKEMISELETGFQNLAWKFNHYSSGNYPRPLRVTEGTDLFPFPLAAQIYHIYQFLVGEKEVPVHMYETLQAICELVWANPFTSSADYQIEWEQWERTNLGLFVRCSFTAIALEAGETINSKQLSLMVGMTSPGIIKNIRQGKLKATKDSREWVIEAEDALAFIRGQLETRR